MSLHLDKIKEKYKTYLESSKYVFKYCKEYSYINHKYNDTIIILQKLEDTLTNESRKDVVDEKYAKFRANKLLVVLIFDINDLNIEYESIINILQIKTIYKKGEIVFPDNFDKNLNKVCSNGIHYFKTIDAAFYYSGIQSGYTGIWIRSNDNGQIYAKTRIFEWRNKWNIY
jgi:hypothetical protein